MNERTFPARLEALEQVLPFVTSAAATAGVAGESLSQLELAVDELVTNVCRYAYRGGGGDVVIRVGESQGEVTIEIEDRGEPFNPLEAPEPDVNAPLEERRIGGLGIFLVRRMVDRLAYRRENGRNVLVLVVKTAGTGRS